MIFMRTTSIGTKLSASGADRIVLHQHHLRKVKEIKCIKKYNTKHIQEADTKKFRKKAQLQNYVSSFD